MNDHSISQGDLVSFSTSSNYAGDISLNFRSNDETLLNIALSLKEAIDLARQIKDMTTNYVVENPLRESPESEEILWSLRDLFNQYEALDCYNGDDDQIENLTDFLVHDGEYKYREESEYDSSEEGRLKFTK